jgi:hypothetical protein
MAFLRERGAGPPEVSFGFLRVPDPLGVQKKCFWSKKNL